MNSSTKDGDVKKFLFDRHDFDKGAEEEAKPVFTEEQVILAKMQAQAQGKAEGQRDALKAQEEVIARCLTQIGTACEALIKNETGPFCFGETPTMADLCLVPQLANARRFGVDVSAFPRLLKAEAAARNNKAFADAAPDRQPDAE